MKKQHQFEPIIDKKTSKVLILGSLPSVKSTENGFYYGHPQNRFWDVMSSLTDTKNLKQSTSEVKTKTLLSHGIALYDVIEECEIDGSSDSSIRNVVPVDLNELLRGSQIERIYLNGGKAFALFKKYFPNYLSISTKLPSTSPANARATLGQLVSEWSIIKKASH